MGGSGSRAKGWGRMEPGYGLKFETISGSSIRWTYWSFHKLGVLLGATDLWNMALFASRSRPGSFRQLGNAWA